MYRIKIKILIKLIKKSTKKFNSQNKMYLNLNN